MSLYWTMHFWCESLNKTTSIDSSRCLCLKVAISAHYWVQSESSWAKSGGCGGCATQFGAINHSLRWKLMSGAQPHPHPCQVNVNPGLRNHGEIKNQGVSPPLPHFLRWFATQMVPDQKISEVWGFTNPGIQGFIAFRSSSILDASAV